MLLFVALIFGGVLLWLRFYTNHGQKLELPEYIGTDFEEARKDAKKKSFELIIDDSIHIVGKPGGLVWTQNPIAGSLVKENRKIYVDVTKYSADLIDIKSIGTMYGQEYNRMSSALLARKINSTIKGYKYDAGEPDHILEVWYEGKLIDGQQGKKTGVKIKKGDQLEFVLSKSDGAQIKIPDLRCQSLIAVKSILKFSKLKLGNIEMVGGAVTDLDKAYVISQDPVPNGNDMIQSGQLFNLTVQQAKPEDCD